MNANIKKYLDKVLILFVGFFVVLLILELFLPAKISRVEKIIGNGTKDKITIEFDRLMNNFSVEDNLVIEPNLDIEKIWNGKNLTITFNDKLIENQNYNLKISNLAMAVEGKRLGKDYSYSFSLPKRNVLLKTFDGDVTKLSFKTLDDNLIKSFDLPLKIKDLNLNVKKNRLYFLGHGISEESVDELTLSYSDPNLLYQLDLETGEYKVITDNRGFDNKKLLMSKNGEKLILARIQKSVDGENLSRIKLFISDIDNLSFTALNNGNAEGLDFMFTPDSAGMVFRNKDGNFELKNIDQVEEGFFVGEFSDVLDFHPFKPEIVFTKYDQSDIFSMKNDLIVFGSDGGQKKLKLPVGVVKEAKYSVDGQSLFIIFSLITDQINDVESFYPLRIYHVYRYDFARDELVQLTQDQDFSEENLVVDPSGNKIYFLQFAKAELMEVDPEYRDLFESIGDKIQEADIIEMNLLNGQVNKIFNDIKNFLIY